MIWRDFEAATPELAARGRERFEQTHVALLGTLRRDGSPRISPVEPYMVQGHLLFGVMRSAKASDLLRDARCVMHTSVSDPNGSEGEFKLFGRAVLVTDAELRGTAPDAWWKSYPADAASVFSMDIESATFIAWDFEAGTCRVTGWSPERGISRSTRLYP